MIDAVWYGYDFRGLNEVDDQNVDSYLDTSAESNHNVAPWKPIYYAGYIQDKIEFRDLVINLGLRVDVFDSNTLVLQGSRCSCSDHPSKRLGSDRRSRWR